MNIFEISKNMNNCSCGHEHKIDLKSVEIGSGIVGSTGKILIKNNFPKKILLVADKNTLNASKGLLESLKDFDVTFHIYNNLREAQMKEVECIEKMCYSVDGILSVGTGSINDICRLAAYRQNKQLAIFATAPSMDGFASDSAPIVEGNFKITFPAKMPDIIIADTKILAESPSELKSAGFGDMVAKYIALIDWQVSTLITGEYYCEKVAQITRNAVDKIMTLADKITLKDEEAASAVFESLLLTGIAMSFTKNSRPASGTEHILSHFWECKKLLNNEISDFHGKKVGVATLLIKKEYDNMVKNKNIKAHKEINDWDKIYSAYGELKDDVIKLNEPNTITENIKTEDIEKNWEKIRAIVNSTPSYNEIFIAMKKAGCATTVKEINVSDELKLQGLKYHPYMRRRISLFRLKNMINFL